MNMKQTARIGTLVSAVIVTVLVCTMSSCNPDKRQRPSNIDSKTVKFMVIADIHHGYLEDVNKRLQVILDQAKQEENVDFIIQLGDFILDPTKSKSGNFMELWNSFKGPKYHVLGNHDMDLTDKAQVRALWGMPANYYSFDLEGFRFIVLDGNHIKHGEDKYIDYENSNYYTHEGKRGYFGLKQLEWFKEQLASTDLNVVVFSHQRLSDKTDGADMKKAIDDANTKAGFGKVILSLNGHGHRDRSELINNVPYVEIPTAAHKWDGKAIPYTTVRFAVINLDPKGAVEINGRSVEFDYQNKGIGEFAEGDIKDKSFRFVPKSKPSTSPSQPGAR
jgi:3',5'-cyclic AMP phosphodiesterase CpdA